MNSILFQPFRLHDLTLPNRIVLAPMTRSRAGAARLPNRLMAEYYSQRSAAGLLVTEATTISEEAEGWSESPGIYTDEMTEGWKHTTNAAHETGGVIFLQLWHTGRASHSSFHGGKPAVAPSAIKSNEPEVHTASGKQPPEIPRALETAEVRRVVQDYRRAAERAKEAGFDGVELHAANGYLIDEFLRSKTNHRTDEYGGSVENRYRFLKEVIEAVTSVWSAGRVGVHLSPNGPFNDMGSPDYREQFTFVAGQLDRFGLAYLHLVDGLAFGLTTSVSQ
jgi:2,4-dienoyl-CoA reductase-like NADH-dependent reductase (Old Yellow Enzyme family)